jgi:hypothetical protein
MVNAVQQQALMIGVGAEIGGFEQPIDDSEAGLPIAIAVGGFSAAA